MTAVRLALGLLVIAALNACRGQMDLSCDEVSLYQLAAESERVRAPEDLDDLDPLREIPLPEASPRPDRPEGSPCLDRPPAVVIGN